MQESWVLNSTTSPKDCLQPTFVMDSPMHSPYEEGLALLPEELKTGLESEGEKNIGHANLTVFWEEGCFSQRITEDSNSQLREVRTSEATNLPLLSQTFPSNSPNETVNVQENWQLLLDVSQQIEGPEEKEAKSEAGEAQEEEEGSTQVFEPTDDNRGESQILSRQTMRCGSLLLDDDCEVYAGKISQSHRLSLVLEDDADEEQAYDFFLKYGNHNQNSSSQIEQNVHEMDEGSNAACENDISNRSEGHAAEFATRDASQQIEYKTASEDEASPTFEENTIAIECDISQRIGENEAASLTYEENKERSVSQPLQEECEKGDSLSLEDITTAFDISQRIDENEAIHEYDVSQRIGENEAMCEYDVSQRIEEVEVACDDTTQHVGGKEAPAENDVSQRVVEVAFGCENTISHQTEEDVSVPEYAYDVSQRIDENENEAMHEYDVSQRIQEEVDAAPKEGNFLEFGDIITVTEYDISQRLEEVDAAASDNEVQRIEENEAIHEHDVSQRIQEEEAGAAHVGDYDVSQRIEEMEVESQNKTSFEKIIECALSPRSEEVEAACEDVASQQIEEVRGVSEGVETSGEYEDVSQRLDRNEALYDDVSQRIEEVGTPYKETSQAQEKPEALVEYAYDVSQRIDENENEAMHEYDVSQRIQEDADAAHVGDYDVSQIVEEDVIMEYPNKNRHSADSSEESLLVVDPLKITECSSQPTVVSQQQQAEEEEQHEEQQLPRNSQQHVSGLAKDLEDMTMAIYSQLLSCPLSPDTASQLPINSSATHQEQPLPSIFDPEGSWKPRRSKNFGVGLYNREPSIKVSRDSEAEGEDEDKVEDIVIDKATRVCETTEEEEEVNDEAGVLEEAKREDDTNYPEHVLGREEKAEEKEEKDEEKDEEKEEDKEEEKEEEKEEKDKQKEREEAECKETLREEPAENKQIQKKQKKKEQDTNAKSRNEEKNTGKGRQKRKVEKEAEKAKDKGNHEMSRDNCTGAVDEQCHNKSVECDTTEELTIQESEPEIAEQPGTTEPSTKRGKGRKRAASTTILNASKKGKRAGDTAVAPTSSMVVERPKRVRNQTAQTCWWMASAVVANAISTPKSKRAVSKSVGASPANVTTKSRAKPTTTTTTATRGRGGRERSTDATKKEKSEKAVTSKSECEENEGTKLIQGRGQGRGRGRGRGSRDGRKTQQQERAKKRQEESESEEEEEEAEVETVKQQKEAKRAMKPEIEYIDFPISSSESELESDSDGDFSLDTRPSKQTKRRLEVQDSEHEPPVKRSRGVPKPKASELKQGDGDDWTDEELERLNRAWMMTTSSKTNPRDFWKSVAERLPGRTQQECQSKWLQKFDKLSEKQEKQKKGKEQKPKKVSQSPIRIDGRNLGTAKNRGKIRALVAKAASRTNEEEDIFEINMKATKMAKHGGAGNKENSANRATDNTDKRDNSRSASSDDASIDSSEDENLPSPLKRLFKDTSQKTAREEDSDSEKDMDFEELHDSLPLSQNSLDSYDKYLARIGKTIRSSKMARAREAKKKKTASEPVVTQPVKRRRLSADSQQLLRKVTCRIDSKKLRQRAREDDEANGEELEGSSRSSSESEEEEVYIF